MVLRNESWGIVIILLTAKLLHTKRPSAGTIVGRPLFPKILLNACKDTNIFFKRQILFSKNDQENRPRNLWAYYLYY